MNLSTMVVALLALGFGVPSMAAKVLDYDERSAPDLSGNILLPTHFTVDQVGQYVVYGGVENSAEDDTFEPGGPSGDYDVFRFNIQDGFKIDSIEFTHIRSGTEEIHFVYELGPSLSVNTAKDLDGFQPFASGLAHLFRSNLKDELLPSFFDGSFYPNGSPGVSVSEIRSGNHTFAVQTASVARVEYGFTFNVVVPEPSSGALLALLSSMFLGWRRRPC